MIITHLFKSDSEDEEEIAPVAKPSAKRTNTAGKGKGPANGRVVKGNKVSVSVTFVCSLLIDMWRP